jgi:hypothetical protein
MWVRETLASPALIDLLSDGDRLFEHPDCLIVKSQKKIKIGRVPLQPVSHGTVAYIKRYNSFSLRYRIQSLFFSSGAARSLRGAMILGNAGIATARPLAAVEVYHWGMLEKSFYFSAELTGAKTADAYWRENLRTIPGAGGFQLRRRFLSDLSRLFRRLHQERIYHNDLKDFNILVRKDRLGKEEFFLLDLEGVRRCGYLSKRRRLKNLVQLNRTLGRLLTRNERLYFLNAYLHHETGSRESRLRWIKEILLASKKGDRLSLAKSRGLGRRRGE